MLWVLVDVAIALAALVVLVLVGLSLWRHVRALMRSVSAASESLPAVQAPDRRTA